MNKCFSFNFCADTNGKIIIIVNFVKFITVNASNNEGYKWIEFYKRINIPKYHRLIKEPQLI